MFSGVVAGDAYCVSITVMNLGVILTFFAVTCEAGQGTEPGETQCWGWPLLLSDPALNGCFVHLSTTQNSSRAGDVASAASALLDRPALASSWDLCIWTDDVLSAIKSSAVKGASTRNRGLILHALVFIWILGVVDRLPARAAQVVALRILHSYLLWERMTTFNMLSICKIWSHHSILNPEFFCWPEWSECEAVASLLALVFSLREQKEWTKVSFCLFHMSFLLWPVPSVCIGTGGC